MAKFLAELLGCTLPSKGASPMFESKSHSRVGLKSSTKQKTTIFSTLASEKSLSDCKKIIEPGHKETFVLVQVTQ
ncbi:RASGEF1B isoform 10 [Pan troglodytes]|uniref:RasGEF domain family member 1B n=2 Tax=Homininae TaxID=207598 RepID=A0A0G2JLL4_HUMAN|nr:RasGEF domain family member 1B [Homo sapiens]KAI4025929.1 RasGEF domain family member 1B [Homo sapiens]PNI82980.1 RASGEF1B isoform 10 [Pan troglodytes]